MAVVSRPTHDGSWLRTGLVAAAAVAVSVLVVLAGLAVRSARESGDVVTQYRTLAPFTSVDLAGANLVEVRVGPAQSVAVTAEDGVVDHVTTVVREGRLVIDNDKSFTTRARMTVAVSVPTLDGITLSGSGTVAVEGVAASAFRARLSGAGTLTAAGRAERLEVVLSATGTADLGKLTADDVVARLDGTGTITVDARSTLDATLTGTGSIIYTGSPSVVKSITGTGTISHD